MEKIIVTGGCGFIGSNFIEEAIGQYKIINIDKLTYASTISSIENTNYSFVQADICNSLIQNIFLAEQPVAIINFAAETHVDNSIAEPDAFIKTNITGTFNLLATALDYYNTLPADKKNRFRFLQISTDEVYGSLDMDSPAFTETTPYQPNSPYSASKAAADHLVRAYFHTYGLPTLTTNCSNNYGPKQFPEKLIPLVISKAIAGADLPIYGTGLNVRDWLHVQDHCKAILTVLQKGTPGEVYNIGGNCEKTNIDVVKQICRILDEELPKPDKYEEQIAYVPDRLGHDLRYAIDSSKIKRELGWEPEHTFDEGLRQTVSYYINYLREN